MAKGIKLNSPGIRALLQSEDMMAGVSHIAASEGQIVKKYVGFDRVQVITKKGGSYADRADHHRASEAKA